MIDFKPQKWEEVAGQSRIKETLKTLIEYSKKTNEVVQHCLFLGPSGSGKTSIAQVMANEVGGNLWVVNCPQVKTDKEIYDIFRKLSTNDFVLLEEIHGLNRKLADSLLVAIEQFYYVDSGIRKKINEFTAIAATTDEALVPIALRNRFKFKARFDPYTEEELVDIAYLTAKRMGFELSKSMAEKISKVSRGVPREVSQNTEFVRMYMIANDLKSIKSDKFYDIISLRGYNKDGLRNQDLDYLKCLKEGPVSLSNICSKLCIDKLTVSEDIEPFLIKNEFVEIVTKGRRLTSKGYNYEYI